MLTVARLRKHPRHFHTFTGLTPAQFDALLAALTPVYAAQELARKQGRVRQRAVGAGQRYTLALPERLLLVLVGLRLYVTDALLGYLVGLHESNVGRERTYRMLPALDAVLPMPLRTELGLLGGGDGTPPDAAAARRKIGTLEELLERLPEVREVLVDATEQPVPRPQDPGRQQTHYSGKKKRHSTKTQVTTTAEQRLVLHATRAVPGSVHDLTLLRFSGLLHQLPPGVRVRLDRGYEGLDAAYPAVAIEKPLRAHGHHRLTALGRAYNRMQSRLRIPVEHALAALEKFQILAGVYRGRPHHYDACFGVVAGLHNFRTLGRLAW